MAKRTHDYLVEHDDGRQLLVNCVDDREATSIAMDEWRETDINTITVYEERE